jgi:hypothetical protein
MANYSKYGFDEEYGLVDGPTKSQLKEGYDGRYSQYGFDEENGPADHIPNLDPRELKLQHQQLKEGFSTGSVAFWLTLLLTIGAGFATDKSAQFVASKFMPDLGGLLENPILAKIAQKGQKYFMKAASKINIVSSIAYMATVTFVSLFLVWIANTVTLTAVIYKECKRIDVKTAMRNAWAGAIPTCVLISIHVVVVFLLQKFPITAIFATTIDTMFGTAILITLMVIVNLIFNAGLGQATSKKQGCAPKPPAPSPA